MVKKINYSYLNPASEEKISYIAATEVDAKLAIDSDE